MGRTSQDDELDDLRANLEEDPDLADAFARLEAGKDSRRERRSGSEFTAPLKGFVAVESSSNAPTERVAERSRPALPSLHDDDDDAPPDTPTRRYVKSEHAVPSLGEPPPSTHRTPGPPPKRPPLPKPAPPPARASGPGAVPSQRSKPNPLVYGPVSSPNGAPSAPDPLMPVTSGPVISVRDTNISMPPEEHGPRVTPVVGAPLTPASPLVPPAPSSSPVIDSGFALPPLADSVESAQSPDLAESDARGAAPPIAGPATAADEREGSGTRMWFLIAATLFSAAVTVVVLMFVVRPLKPSQSATAPTDTAIAAPPSVMPQATAPVATVAPPATTAPAEPTQPPPAATEVAATPPTPSVAPPGAATPGAAPPVAAPTPVAGAGTFVPQFTKQPPAPTARPLATAKPTTATTAAPKSTGVSPIFEFER